MKGYTLEHWWSRLGVSECVSWVWALVPGAECRGDSVAVARRRVVPLLRYQNEVWRKREDSGKECNGAEMANKWASVVCDGGEGQQRKWQTAAADHCHWAEHWCDGTKGKPRRYSLAHSSLLLLTWCSFRPSAPSLSRQAHTTRQHLSDLESAGSRASGSHYCRLNSISKLSLLSIPTNSSTPVLPQCTQTPDEGVSPQEGDYRHYPHWRSDAGFDAFLTKTVLLSQRLTASVFIWMVEKSVYYKQIIELPFAGIAISGGGCGCGCIVMSMELADQLISICTQTLRFWFLIPMAEASMGWL